MKLLAVLFVLSKVSSESLGSWFYCIYEYWSDNHFFIAETQRALPLFANYKQGFTDHLRDQKRGPFFERPTWDKGSINLHLNFEQIISPRPAYAKLLEVVFMKQKVSRFALSSRFEVLNQNHNQLLHATI